MLLKIAFLLTAGCLMFRWAFGQWPWHALTARPTRDQAIFNARKLLRVEQGATREQILAAHKRLVAMVHPDKGGTNSQVHDANDARDLLLEELPARVADLPSDSD
ncbi:molecular chaperone DnaJ [uncultured Erythrobacter sp.]|uniref:molecular chaperone DnaJ n=1 Tax=uncultured Erythrobacter sp. TaxID=263913 RepID=UPI0026098974|nr:molecular chaperone DnaJ [uncultured Erythrobacter sp.]